MEKRKIIGSVIVVKSQVRLWFILIYPNHLSGYLFEIHLFILGAEV